MKSRVTSALPELGWLPAGASARVLMVCTGNICRSPTAHGVLEKLVADAGLAGRVQVDSAGTHGYHVGESALRAGGDLPRSVRGRRAA